MQVFFESRLELAPDIWEYAFRPERPVRFVPGQYVELRFTVDVADPRGNSRTFTLVSLPAEETIRFVVKFPRHISPYKAHLAALSPGDSASITDAMGDVVLPKLATIPLLFVAGGIGLASFVSMLQWLTANSEQRRIRLLYGVRTPDQRIYSDLLRQFPFASQRVFVAPARITAADIVAQAGSDSLIYLSGSETFVEGLREDLRLRGISSSRIVYDFFDGYSDRDV